MGGGGFEHGWVCTFAYVCGCADKCLCLFPVHRVYSTLMSTGVYGCVPYCVHVSVCTPRPYHMTSCLGPIFPCLRAATHIPAGMYTRVHLRPRGSVLSNMND